MNAAPRAGKELIDATRPYASESRALSWWHTVSTFALLAGATAAAASSALPWPARLIAAVLEALLIVRGFILYHDYLHGALLRGSKVARALFYPFGVLVLTPPKVWRQTHNYHHAHTAKIIGSHVGSYAMLTTELWAKTPPKLQRMYKITRHPLTIAAGYVTIFLYGMCLSSFLRTPRKNWDSLLALIVHAALCTAVVLFAGWDVLLLTVTIPMIIAFAAGAYLFYAQHNFPDIQIQPRESWEYTRAALESSSYMKTGAVMAFFTGNIGYHHVHHLNPGIPFYRLPEAMAGVPELQHPHVTTLHPRDIIANFRLKLWDAQAGRMVGYPSASSQPSEPTQAQQAA